MNIQIHLKIAQCIANFNKAMKENALNDNFDLSEYLIDEFCYMLEESSNFNEKVFRQYIIEKTNLN